MDLDNKIDGMGINWHIYILHHLHVFCIHRSFKWDKTSNKETKTQPENRIKLVKINEINHRSKKILSIISFSTWQLTAQHLVLLGYWSQWLTDSLRKGIMEIQKCICSTFCSQVLKSLVQDLWKLNSDGNREILYQRWANDQCS